MPRVTHVHRWALLAVLLGAVAVTVSTQALPSAAGQALIYAVKIGIVLVAARLFWLRAHRQEPSLRRARVLVMGSLLWGSVAGILALGILLITGDPPVGLSLDDAVHFGFLPLAVGGLLSYPVRSTESGSFMRTALDGLLAAASLWFVVYALALQPLNGTSPSAADAVALAYPAADVIVVAMCFSVLARVRHDVRPELLLLAIGLVLYGAADVAYAAQEIEGTYRPDSWVGVLGAAGLVVVVLAALSPPGEPARDHSFATFFSALPFLPTAVAIAVATKIAIEGEPFGGHQTGLALAIVLLLVLRQVVGSRDWLDLVDRLRTREELFRSLVTGSSDLITLHAPDGTVLYASPGVGRVTGLADDRLLGRTLMAAIHPQDRARLGQTLADCVRAGTRRDGTPGADPEVLHRLRTADGDYRWHLTRMHNALDRPAVAGVICNSRDVHERQLLAEEMSHAATHDALTGLGNLAHARDLLRQACARAVPVPVVLVDLDGFKAVNDTFGHADGDALLTEVAARLLDCVRAGDEIARIGGDEFLLVLSGESDGAAVAERILRALRRPFQVAGRPLSVGASLGLTLSQQGTSPEVLLRNADLAMYAAKAAGRGRAIWYEPHMHEAVAHRVQVQRGLRRALDEGRLALHYQPIVRLPGGEAVGLEALLRWHDPELGELGPEEFVPIAEESGLMPEIDTWVLERACQDLSAWRAQGLEPLPVSINISRQDLTSALPDTIAGVLNRHGLPPSLFCLEVTESAVVPDEERALTVLRELKATGVRIALDDFGTGHSSLSQLARLPIDTVKIDKSFVLSSSSDLGARRLLTSIIGVCSSLGLPVVAEGIEDEALVGSLDASGCAFGQGYHFGRPTPSGNVATLLRTADPLAPGEHVVDLRSY